MTPEIVPLDPADEATVGATLALRAAADECDTPDFPPPCGDEFRAALAFQSPYKRVEHYVARTGDRAPVGYLALELPLRDNLDNADLNLCVHPAHRGAGVGRALHAHALDRLRVLGRRRLAAGTVETLPGGPPRAGAGSAFAAAMAAKPALEEVRRRLDLREVDEAGLAAMAAEATTRAAGYEVVRWRDRVPDEYAADVAYLDGRLNSDAPMGDLAWEPERVDTQRVRVREELFRRARISLYTTGAVHRETGRMVAVTTLARMASVPWHAWQWITLVDPQHRGRRLGALTKVENLRYARAHEPDLRAVDTWNAAVNSHMIAINEAMGFRSVDRWIMWQQEVPAAPA